MIDELITSPDIELITEDGTNDNLRMRVKHSAGNKMYLADREYNIQDVLP
jgi:hypothetical protein